MTLADHSQDAPVLIAGAGPAGLSLALGLAHQGTPSLVVDRRHDLSGLPRATGVATRTMEVLRQWGVEAAVRERSVDHEPFFAVAPSMLGPAVARFPLYDPAEMAALSPTGLTICPQDELEPVLLSAATAHPGTEVRFGAELFRFQQDATGVTARVRDVATGAVSTLRARYLVGADGAGSRVRRLLGIAMSGRPMVARYLTVLFRARLGGLALPRPYPLVMLTAPRWTGGDQRSRVIVASGSDRWVLGVELEPDAPRAAVAPSAVRLRDMIRSATGVADLEPEILGVQTFPVAAGVSERYRAGRVFLAGDAAHRMPPSGGMGMNTGVQDSHNLAWKLSGAVQGWAGEELLDSYEEERRPAGEQAVGRALDLGGPTLPLAVELELRYRSRIVGQAAGERLPHRWVTADGARVSTLDLVGRGFTLLTGPAATPWHAAARAAAERLRVPARTVSITPAGLGTSPFGAVLVRPDGHVASRWQDLPVEPERDLRRALARAVGRSG